MALARSISARRARSRRLLTSHWRAAWFAFSGPRSRWTAFGGLRLLRQRDVWLAAGWATANGACAREPRHPPRWEHGLFLAPPYPLPNRLPPQGLNNPWQRSGPWANRVPRGALRTRGAMAQTQVVHVEGWYAVTVFGGVVQHLAQGSNAIAISKKLMTNRALGPVAIGLVAMHSVALSSRQ